MYNIQIGSIYVETRSYFHIAYNGADILLAGVKDKIRLDSSSTLVSTVLRDSLCPKGIEMNSEIGLAGLRAQLTVDKQYFDSVMSVMNRLRELTLFTESFK
jgi:hypothetical protein